MVSLT